MLYRKHLRWDKVKNKVKVNIPGAKGSVISSFVVDGYECLPKHNTSKCITPPTLNSENNVPIHLFEQRNSGDAKYTAVLDTSKKAASFITFWYTNANNLCNKMDEFQGRVAIDKPDVIGVTEVWMKETFNINGYHPAIRQDRAEEKRGGGVALFVRENLEIIDCNTMTNDQFKEAVWCYIRLNKINKLLVGVCYRSPSADDESNQGLFDMLRKTRDQFSGETIVMGDFNFPQINWEEGIVTGTSLSPQAQFYETVQDLYWQQNVSVQTRFREGQNPSRLDLVFTSHDSAVEDMEVTGPIGKSDHIVLHWKYFLRCNAPRKDEHSCPKRKNFKKGRYSEMKASLQDVNWETIQDCDIEQAWTLFKQVLNERIDKYVPNETIKKAGIANKPWWNKELTKEVKRKHKLWKRYTCNKSTCNYQLYTVQRNQVTQKIRQARSRHEDGIIKRVKDDPKALHKYIRMQQRVKPKVQFLEDGAGSLAETDQETADVFNRFFKSVFLDYYQGEVPEFPDQVETTHAMQDIDITPDVARKQLVLLDETKAPGPDGIPSIVLSKCAEELAYPLCLLYRKSLETGSLPKEWKFARISAIFKKGSKRKPENYRPVSLTSQPCKVLERIVREQIIEHLNVNNILSGHQHGFRRKRSCLTNLLESYETWTKLLDDGTPVDIIYCDFRKAFDRVSHKHLIRKLSAYGLRNRVLEWLTDFLSDRWQAVSVGKCMSSPVRVTSGVPQGSVLGPVLFLLYINELPRLTKSELKMFADDVKIYRGIKSANDLFTLQEDLTALTHWSKEWLLDFNISKCKVMHLGHLNPSHDYIMEQSDGIGVKLQVTKLERDLGVLVADSLKATAHCQTASRRVTAALRQLKMAFPTL